jgi:tRNA G46 methylase TrmB
MGRQKYKSNILKYKKDYDGHHPTQKPILLLEDLIKTFSNENNLVVDLTLGSGSTGVACKNTNRSFIGIEKDEELFQMHNVLQIGEGTNSVGIVRWNLGFCLCAVIGCPFNGLLT